jgi:hypothetical protein
MEPKKPNPLEELRRQIESLPQESVNQIVAPPQIPEDMRKERQGLTAYESQQIRQAAEILFEMQRETLALYEHLPHVEDFHRYRIPERKLRGSNRSGKTLAPVSRPAIAKSISTAGVPVTGSVPAHLVRA